MSESRYMRQEALPQIGEAGQAALARARVAVVGVGALGSVSASVLARSGVGYLRLIDRDFVSLSNLQRCALYTEADAAAVAPKALAAAAHLASINSTVNLRPHVEDVSSSNVLELLADVDLILDGSDNLELRYLLNETAQRLGTPWFYTGVLGTLGMVMPVMPGGPCLCCLSPIAPVPGSSPTAPAPGSSPIAPVPGSSPTAPAPGSYPSCATSGVLATTTRMAASLQASLAIKHLVRKAGGTDEPFGPKERTTTLYQLDVWEPELETITVAQDPNCPVCGQRQGNAT
jgi:adenylyltransferase/sulfurtransferase